MTVLNLTSRHGTSAPAAPDWPTATVALESAAQHRLRQDLERHAELAREHADQVRQYVALLESGVWISATCAADRAATIVDLERRLRCIERDLAGDLDDR